MPDVNWGLLQPAQSMAPIREATPQAQGGGMLSAPTGNPFAGQEANTAAQAQQAQQQYQQGELKLQQDRQPGLLEEQKLTNQGLGLTNQKTQNDIAAQQYGVQVRTNAVAAYVSAKKQGGVEAGLDAMQEAYIKGGDADTALKMDENRTKIKGMVADNNIKGLNNVANAVFNIQKTASTPEAQKDGITGLSIYKQQYPTLKKTWPDAPDPKSFKNDVQFEDGFVHPVLDTALAPIQKQQAEEKAIQENKVYQAQQIVQQRQRELTNLLQTKGANDPATISAKNDLQEAQQNAAREAGGNNYITGTVRSAGSLVGITTPQDVQNIPKQIGGFAYDLLHPAQPSAPVTPKGQPVNTNQPQVPPFSPQEIQAELDRRQASAK